jgi:SAM-dependent methyltransferase
MSYFSQHYGKMTTNWGADQFYWQMFFGGITGKILDIGCSTGRYMVLAKSLKQDICGIDVDADALQIARDRGLEVKLGNIENRLDFEDNSFAAIHFHAVIEHLRDPLSALKECYRLLAPGGKLVCLTMNIDQCKWKFWSMSYTHVSPFSKNSLEEVAIDADFKHIKTVYEPRYVPLSKHLSDSQFLRINSLAFRLGWQQRDKIILIAYKI